MAHKLCFETVDASFRDILKQVIHQATDKPFGGMTMVLGGDFRKILPVVTKGGRRETIDACIKSLYLWKFFEVFTLTENMRLKSLNESAYEIQEVREFAEWILEIGDGKGCNENGEGFVDIPKHLLFQNTKCPINTIVDAVYHELLEKSADETYLQQRAILTPTNEMVDDINNHIISLLPRNEMIYLSSDTLSNNDANAGDCDLLYPSEFLNSLKLPGLPNHVLRLKVGVPVMLMRNIDQTVGLCNGTRLVVTQLGRWFIEGKIITGSNIGDKVLISRIVLSPSDTKWPFTLNRKQFPITACYAMTINKNQGQSLQKVGLYLLKQVFTHGQLYVALSRVTTRSGIQILISDDESPDEKTVKTIVYEEVL